MREIKFRAWDAQLGIMCEFDLGVVCSYTSLNFPIMQFTGLKDRHGVDIYEGDILEEGQGYFFEVVWDDLWAKFKLKHGAKAIQYPEWNRGVTMERVGNIYQNPGLLEPESPDPRHLKEADEQWGYEEKEDGK